MASILLAEDNESLRIFLAKALGRAGHLVTSCNDGHEAIAALKLRNYDLLLADIVMPKIGGVEVAQHAVTHAPGIKILFITGLGGIALRINKTDTDNPKVLPKSFHLRNVVNEVDQMFSEAG